MCLVTMLIVTMTICRAPLVTLPQQALRKLCRAAILEQRLDKCVTAPSNCWERRPLAAAGARLLDLSTSHGFVRMYLQHGLVVAHLLVDCIECGCLCSDAVLSSFAKTSNHANQRSSRATCK